MALKLFKAAAISLTLVITCLLYTKSQQLGKPQFALNGAGNVFTESGRAFFESQLIPQPKFLPAAHSSSFTSLANGDLLAFWFAGTKEGRPDVKIWQAIYHGGEWQMAHALVDPQMIAKANHRYVIKVGNPVIYRAQNNLLHLFVVSVSVGGWSGSALNHLISTDNGISWSKPERIIISPFFNISTLVRTSAVTLADGGFYLPVYMELWRKYPELLRFDSNGNFIEQIRITAQNKLIQPSIMPISSEKAWVYFRNASPPGAKRELFAAMTYNGGKTWSKPQPSNLTNPDSSVVAANLADGHYLLVYNQGDRTNLWLAISSNGLNWRPIYCFESAVHSEFSYPAIQVNNDHIDILYTDNRKNIKQVSFNREWLTKVMTNASYH